MRRADAVHSVALMAHAAPRDVVAYRRGHPIHGTQFLNDVARVAAHLPPTGHVLNACQDRYLFAVGFAAAVVSSRVSLLPSTHTPEVIRQLRNFAPDAVCLTDDPGCGIELPLVSVLGGTPPRLDSWQVPLIPADQLVAYVFTSGTSGLPVPHAKTWGPLAQGVATAAARLGVADGPRRAIVATVPPQHMYGFESSVLLALQSGNSLCAERPFFPADIAATLAGVPAPRVLISTPVHLRSLLASDLKFPELELIVSATAPLAAELALEVEQRFRAPLLEIYGSTETGQIASRPARPRPMSGGSGRACASRSAMARRGSMAATSSARRAWATYSKSRPITDSCCAVAAPTSSTSPANAARSPISTTS